MSYSVISKSTKLNIMTFNSSGKTQLKNYLKPVCSDNIKYTFLIQLMFVISQIYEH